MKHWVYLLFAQCFVLSALAGATATTTLSLVEGEGSFGIINVTVSPPIGSSSSDTTTLTGDLSIELEVDTDTDTVSSLTATGSNISGSQLSFSAGGGFFSLVSYDATSSETIGVDVFTAAPPGAVDPATGNYNASDHPFLIDEGTLTGSASILGTPSIIDVDFATTPFGSENVGIGGNVSLSLQSTTDTTKTYSVVLIYPVSTIATLPAGTIDVDVVIAGTVKASGTITVPLLTNFEIWLDDNDLSGETFEGDNNQDGLPNGIQWALGLTADESPKPHMLTYLSSTPANVSYTLELPVGGSAGDLTILHSSDLSQGFTPLTSGSVSAGNPIPAGSAGTVTITLLPGNQAFLQMSATAP